MTRPGQFQSAKFKRSESVFRDSLSFVLGLPIQSTKAPSALLSCIGPPDTWRLLHNLPVLGFPMHTLQTPYVPLNLIVAASETGRPTIFGVLSNNKEAFIYDRPITVKLIIMFSLFASNCVSTCLFVYSLTLTQYRSTNSQQPCQGLKLQSTALHFRRMAGFSPVAVCTSVISNA